MPTPDQLELLLRQASKQLGVTPQQLKNAAQSGQLDSIISSMNAGDADKFRKVLSDPNAANRMLSSPQAQKLLQMLSNPPKGGK